MKTSDLMVGDLVYIHEPECKGHRIDYISEMDEEVGADGELYSVNDIRPIPLTEEILEKNGLNWDIIAKFNAALMAYICGEIKCDNDWRTPRIQYVHQLQNLLLIVGIEKEIEL